LVGRPNIGEIIVAVIPNLANTTKTGLSPSGGAATGGGPGILLPVPGKIKVLAKLHLPGPGDLARPYQLNRRVIEAFRAPPATAQRGGPVEALRFGILFRLRFVRLVLLVLRTVPMGRRLAVKSPQRNQLEGDANLDQGDLRPTDISEVKHTDSRFLRVEVEINSYRFPFCIAYASP
jgi:hypothetical protein